MVKTALTCIILACSIDPGALFSQCLSGDCDNGFGKFRYEDGSVYEGDSRNKKAHGKGTKYDGKGVIIYQGEYRYGKLWGKRHAPR